MKKTILSKLKTFSTLALMVLQYSVQAQEPVGLDFSYKDWQLVCDNTRTCRAAGYQTDGDELAVSVLLTRKAGPNQPVTGEMMVGIYDDDSVLGEASEGFKLTMKINGQDLGGVVIDQDSAKAKLSEAQVAVLLTSLRHDSHIEWFGGGKRWQLSDKGASAALLKMDEFQGRIGTPGALVKKGSNNELSVQSALPDTVLIVPPLEKPQPDDERWLSERRKDLLEALRASATEEDCSDLWEHKMEEVKITVERLNNGKRLASTQCWTAAYNQGYGYWVINEKAPYEALLVTTAGTFYENGHVYAVQKGRGLGDCESHHAWSWDGNQFIETDRSTTGLCKLVAAGGAWVLPTLTVSVRQSAK
ncbi:MAG: DUF1176 domain-containing protein [Gammaproteobacteria bacterium]